MKRLPSLNATRALEKLGRDINLARRRRRMSIEDFSERTGISPATIGRLEKGDPGVSIGAVAMAFVALGELKRISNLLDTSQDSVGLFLSEDDVPKRIRKRKTAGSGPQRGMGF